LSVAIALPCADTALCALYTQAKLRLDRQLSLIQINRPSISGALLAKTEDGGDSMSDIGLDIRMSITSNSEPKNAPLAMFAVAGAVAEICWQHVAFDESLDDDIWYVENAMSRSGWAGCDCSAGRPTRQLYPI
jgi:hypothetical protein